MRYEEGGRGGAEEQDAHKNAAKECKAARDEDPAGFADLWGRNDNDRNALGKCVSTTAKEKEHEADAQDQEQAAELKDAAKACAGERSEGESAFNAKWGENDGDQNAFGKCVSRTVRGLGPAQPVS